MKTKILLDIDDLLLDTKTSWLGFHNQDYNSNLTKFDITDWGMVSFVHPDCGNKIYEYLDRPDFYEKTQPIEGAQEGVKALRELGYTVKFVSAGFWSSKIECLNRFGFLVNFPYNDGRWQTTTDAMLVNDKNDVIGDVLVDDRPKNLIDFHSGGILFDQPWNQEHKGHHRVFNWEELVEVIKELYG